MYYLGMSPSITAIIVIYGRIGRRKEVKSRTLERKNLGINSERCSHIKGTKQQIGRRSESGFGQIHTVCSDLEMLHMALIY
jgi:hypothetical protein